MPVCACGFATTDDAIAVCPNPNCHTPFGDVIPASPDRGISALADDPVAAAFAEQTYDPKVEAPASLQQVDYSDATDCAVCGDEFKLADFGHVIKIRGKYAHEHCLDTMLGGEE